MLKENHLTEAEKVIFRSAMERSGVFAQIYNILWQSDRGIVLSDGATIYPLGQIGKTSTPVGNHTCVLGRKDNVRKLLGARQEWLFMDKIFSRYTISGNQSVNEMPKGITVETVSDEKQIEEFCRMKREFLEEESENSLTARKILNSFRKSGGGVLPVIMRKDGAGIGMVSSSFHSKDGAMINMLFVEKEHRSKGYGMLLLDWYINYLRKHSEKIFLFYSPENEPARKMYEKRGFVEIDRWLMAVPTVPVVDEHSSSVR